MGLFWDTLTAPSQTMTRELGLRIYYAFKAAFRADELTYQVAAKQLDSVVTSKSIEQNIAAIVGDVLTEDRLLGRQNAEERAEAFIERFNMFYPGLI